MKLKSLLDVIDDNEPILVIDENATIKELTLFDGFAKNCKKRSDIKYGIVKSVFYLVGGGIGIAIDKEEAGKE